MFIFSVTMCNDKEGQRSPVGTLPVMLHGKVGFDMIVPTTNQYIS